MLLGFTLAWCCAGSGIAAADEDAVIGKVALDRMVYQARDTILVTWGVENQTNSLWTYAEVTDRVCRYEMTDESTGSAVANGTLQPSGAQYVAPGQSDVFAYGAIPISTLPGGTYRLFVSAPDFQGIDSGLVKSLGAGTVFHVKKKK
jgi:hypothetical protein